MIDAAHGLGPDIAACADSIDANGRLPEALARQMTDARIFQMYLPAAVGGADVDPLVAYSVCEALARRDGSVGWCAQVSAAVTIFLAWLDPAAVATMADLTDGPIHVAGSARALGTAESVEGGYLASGQWNYASGIRHANWFMATCLIERNGRPPAPRTMFIPVADGHIVDNWQVVGMRGTGSDDFVLDRVFVPQERVAARHWIEHARARSSERSISDPRLGMVGAWVPTAGVGVGLAQGALDALLDLGDVASAGSPEPLRTRPAVQEAVADAEAITGAARAFAIETFAEVWDALADGGPRLDRAVARAQLAITHSLNEAVRVADLAFRAGGTNAISTRNRLERYLRDAHTAVQHAAGQRIHMRTAGQALLELS
ncbi:MAG: acyl-CoA dehydrogenase family protein [Actinomycetota bacterium]|nr:acyl-CoA dehydrogenase family protein [Actinomycetota bacterium]